MDPLSPRPDVSPSPPPPVATSAPRWPRAPRSLEASRGVAWWSEGWRIFTVSPMLWIGIVLTMIVISIVLSLIPILGYIAQPVLSAVLIGGILLGCHAMANGRPLEFSHLFAGFAEGRTTPLLILGGVAFAMSLVFALVMMMLVFGAMGFSGMAGMMSGDPGVALGSALAGMGVAAMFAIPLAIVVYGLFMMAWWFAPALVAINRADAFQAMKASFDASLKNLGAFLVFGLVFIGLAIAATIPFGLGWLVLLPVTFGGLYASWREVFGE